jgi:plasmid maintenance system antidote protein VapI
MTDRIPFDPDWTMRPGVILREMMDYGGLTGRTGVRMIATIAGLDEAVVDGILAGAEPITEQIAQHLAAGTAPLRVPASFWLNAETIYRDGLAKGKKDISDDMAGTDD